MTYRYMFGSDAKRALDLLVYHLSEEEYYREQKAAEEAAIRGLGLDPKSKEPHVVDLKEHLFRPWDLNEVVGIVRVCSAPGKIGALGLYLDGRITKRRVNKRFFFSGGGVFEFDVWLEDSSSTIYDRLRKYLTERASNHSFLSQRTIDLEPLDTLGPHIDWVALTRPQRLTGDGA